MEFALQHGITAASCCNDRVAIDLRNEAHNQGLDLPRDLSLISVNDDHEAAANGLTAVNVNLALLGKEGIAAWLRLRDGAAAAEASRTTPVHLVVRNSVESRH